jgi:hypothetical protein
MTAELFNELLRHYTSKWSNSNNAAQARRRRERHGAMVFLLIDSTQTEKVQAGGKQEKWGGSLHYSPPTFSTLRM